jgi:hypothetical protein
MRRPLVVSRCRCGPGALAGGAPKAHCRPRRVVVVGGRGKRRGAAQVRALQRRGWEAVVVVVGRGPVPRRVVVRSDTSSDASAVRRQPLSLWPRRPRRGCAGGALPSPSCRCRCRAGQRRGAAQVRALQRRGWEAVVVVVGRGPVPRRVVVRSDASSDASAVGRQPLSLWPRRPRRGCAEGALPFTRCRCRCRAGTCAPPGRCPERRIFRCVGRPSSAVVVVAPAPSPGVRRRRTVVPVVS